MTKTRMLDKETQKYHNRRKKFETPGWIMLTLSIIFIIAGLLKTKILLTIGILTLALAIYFIIIGKTTHQIIRK